MTGLTVWHVEGDAVQDGLEQTLRNEPAVEQVARFGSVLHVAGTDAGALAELAARYDTREDQSWTLNAADLEDAFIHLMSDARDNFARDAL